MDFPQATKDLARNSQQLFPSSRLLCSAVFNYSVAQGVLPSLDICGNSTISSVKSQLFLSRPAIMLVCSHALSLTPGLQLWYSPQWSNLLSACFPKVSQR